MFEPIKLYNYTIYYKHQEVYPSMKRNRSVSLESIVYERINISRFKQNDYNTNTKNVATKSTLTDIKNKQTNKKYSYIVIG